MPPQYTLLQINSNSLAWNNHLTATRMYLTCSSKQLRRLVAVGLFQRRRRYYSSPDFMQLNDVLRTATAAASTEAATTFAATQQRLILTDNDCICKFSLFVC